MNYYIDKIAFAAICNTYPGLYEYVRAREEKAYREGYRDGCSLPRPPIYDEEDNLITAGGRKE